MMKIATKKKKEKKKVGQEGLKFAKAEGSNYCRIGGPGEESGIVPRSAAEARGGSDRIQSTLSTHI